jgi:hypothetical protein
MGLINNEVLTIVICEGMPNVTIVKYFLSEPFLAERPILKTDYRKKFCECKLPQVPYSHNPSFSS